MSREDYIKNKEQIENDPHLTDAQKKILLFNNWIDYVYSSVAKAKKKELKYTREKVNVYA